MLQESAGRPDAYSKSGAVGLLQVMPRDGLASKFMCKNGPCFSDRPSMEELFDPEYNLAYGAQMLASLVQHYGNERDALKAYGPKDVGYYYADLVLNTANRYR
jgi:soluble lytic murein transglycosylase-like protein